MRRWQQAYRMGGQLTVAWEHKTFPVAMPREVEVAVQVNPTWEPPSPKAIFSIFGITYSFRPANVDQRQGFASLTGLPLVTDSDLQLMAHSCPGVGWRFDFDAITEPSLRSIAVSVPVGRTNSTSGVVLDQALPWPGPPPGQTMRTSGRSGDRARYQVTADTSADGRKRKWSAEPDGPPAPWLTRFVLELDIDDGEPPKRILLRYESEATLQPALQADIILKPKGEPI